MEKYTLKMPEKNFWLNEKNNWFVGVANTSMYLRQSGKILEYTGYGTDDSGYWGTYEEALKAKEAYERQVMEYPIILQYIGKGLGQYDILELQNEKLGIIVGSKDEYWIGKEMQIESLDNCIEIKLQKTNQSDDMVDAFKYILHSGNTNENESGCIDLKWFGAKNTIDEQWDKLVEESNSGDSGSTSVNSIQNEREDDYGNATESMRSIGEFWGTYISRKQGMEIRLDEIDVAHMMTLFKINRNAYKRKEDNLVDGESYSNFATRFFNDQQCSDHS